MSGNGENIDQVLRVQQEHTRGRAELRSSLAEVRGSVGALRAAVGHYHASVLGQGSLISELDARVRRLEDHSKLPPVAA